MVHMLVECDMAKRRVVIVFDGDNSEHPVILDGDFNDIAGKLYRFGIEHDVAEIAIDTAGPGIALNQLLIDMRYPRLFKWAKGYVGWRRTSQPPSVYEFLVAKIDLVNSNA